ncbi:hypothetical protein D3C85_1359040 [compost metagenome]
MLLQIIQRLPQQHIHTQLRRCFSLPYLRQPLQLRAHRLRLPPDHRLSQPTVIVAGRFRPPALGLLAEARTADARRQRQPAAQLLSDATELAKSLQAAGNNRQRHVPARGVRQ